MLSTMENGLTRSAQAVYQVSYQFVWIPKRGKQVLVNKVNVETPLFLSRGGTSQGSGQRA